MQFSAPVVDIDYFRMIPPETRLAITRPMLNNWRQEVAAQMHSFLRSKDYSLSDVANDLGMTRFLFGHMVKRGLAVPFDSIEKLCDKYLLCSCSQLLLGTQVPAIASLELKAFLENYFALSKAEQVSIKQLFPCSTPGTAVKTPASELIFLRLSELAEDRGVLTEDLVGPTENPAIVAAFRTMLDDGCFAGHTLTFMYFCLAFEVSPDYLLRQDYSRYCFVRLQDGSLHKLTSEEQRIAQQFLLLGRDERYTLSAKVVAQRFIPVKKQILTEYQL